MDDQGDRVLEEKRLRKGDGDLQNVREKRSHARVTSLEQPLLPLLMD